jgi:phosphatidylserine/phosphatidylglycerophosphate/cardiolipin synthase-like enzyme
MVSAIALFREQLASVEVRTLERLHAKCIVIDDSVAYVGSTNFYKFSLEESRELAIRGPLKEMGELLREVEELWQDGSSFQLNATVPDRAIMGGMTDEVADPIVKEILQKNPGAWVIGRRQRSRP